MGSCCLWQTKQQLMSKKIQKNMYSHLKSPMGHSKLHLIKVKQSRSTKIEDQYKQAQLSLPKGIGNVGNTCYMNSVLQCLHKSKSFVKKLAQQLDNSSNKESRQLSKEFWTFIDQMNDIKNRYSFYPTRIKQIIAQKNYIFAGYKQQDATEFFSTFLSIISQELNSNSPQKNSHETQQEIKNHYIKQGVSQQERENLVSQIYQKTKRMDQAYCRSIVDKTFTGRYKITYNCEECGADYIMFQKFNIHYLQIPDEQSQISFNSYYHRSPVYFQSCKLSACLEKSNQQCKLSTCLDKFKQKEKLSGADKMTCDVCERRTNQFNERETNKYKTIKTMEIYEANQIFVIGIKRFYKGYKNRTKIIFPQYLYPQEIMNQVNPRYGRKIYRMYAGILHIGTLHSGHYIAYCLNQTTNIWVEYNDSTTRQRGEFNSIDFGNAYAVFYKLIDIEQQKKIVQLDSKKKLDKFSGI